MAITCARMANVPAPVAPATEPSPQRPAPVASVPRAPVGIEREVLREVNLARSDPAGYASFIEAIDDDAREAIDVLREMAPVPELVWEDRVASAARDHVLDTGASSVLSHEGADGSRSYERVTRYIDRNDVSATGENIMYGARTPRSIVVELIVDRGVPDRGHRHNLFSDVWTHVGVAVGPHAGYETMCVMDFARIGPAPVPVFDGDPAAATSTIIDEINFARARPREYAESIREMNFDPADMLETMDFLRGLAPLRPLARDEALVSLARACVDAVGATMLLDNEVMLSVRVEDHRGARQVNRLRELSSFGVVDVRESVADLIVGAQDPGKAYRTSIFDASFTHVGAAYGPHRRYGVMCVVELARL